MDALIDMPDCSTFACDTCNIHIKVAEEWEINEFL